MNTEVLLRTTALALLLSGCQTTPEPRPIELSAQDYYQQGVYAFERGDFRPAIDDFQRAVELEPGFAEAHCKMGEAYEELRLNAAAIDAYGRCLEIRPANGAAHERIGILYFEARQYVPARSHLEKAVEYAPADHLPYFYLAEIHRKQGECATSLELYRTTLKIAPGFADAKEGLRRTHKDNCRQTARKKAPRKETEFTGGGKALGPGEW